MTQRLTVSSGTQWEEMVGYSRAVRVGNAIEVAGTTAVDEHGAVVGSNDPYVQTQYILAKIDRALREAGGTLRDVVRTRMFVTNIAQWEEIGRAHGDVFRDIKPVATMVQVVALIDPALVVEIEATALLET